MSLNWKKSSEIFLSRITDPEKFKIGMEAFGMVGEGVGYQECPGLYWKNHFCMSLYMKNLSKKFPGPARTTEPE
jgi:hypothetical protein